MIFFRHFVFEELKNVTLLCFKNCFYIIIMLLTIGWDLSTMYLYRLNEFRKSYI